MADVTCIAGSAPIKLSVNSKRSAYAGSDKYTDHMLETDCGAQFHFSIQRRMYIVKNGNFTVRLPQFFPE